jgi:hypothetical protein
MFMRTLIVALFCSTAMLADEAKEFNIVIEREKTEKNLVTGTIFVNGKKLGTVYENDEKKIPLGTFPGVIRTKSMRNHAQGPGGIMSNSGDFLIEVAKVPGRTDILLHGGNRPEHSLGCILCGPVTVDKDGTRHAPDVLKQLRLLFFDGNDKPEASPAKKITIEVKMAK